MRPVIEDSVSMLSYSTLCFPINGLMVLNFLFDLCRIHGVIPGIGENSTLTEQAIKRAHLKKRGYSVHENPVAAGSEEGFHVFCLSREVVSAKPALGLFWNC